MKVDCATSRVETFSEKPYNFKMLFSRTFCEHKDVRWKNLVLFNPPFVPKLKYKAFNAMLLQYIQEKSVQSLHLNQFFVAISCTSLLLEGYLKWMNASLAEDLTSQARHS